jgi:hypothetical protein
MKQKGKGKCSNGITTAFCPQLIGTQQHKHPCVKTSSLGWSVLNKKQHGEGLGLHSFL